MMKYCIDTSALIHGWQRAYSIKAFPALWDRVNGLILDGLLIAPDEVKVELEKKADDLYDWLCNRDSVFIEIDENIQEAVHQILESYPMLLDTRKHRSAADPFVIALAQLEKCTLVTQEGKTGKISKPNIPDVCDALNIHWVTLHDMILEIGWVFKS